MEYHLQTIIIMGAHNLEFKLPMSKFPTEQSVRDWYEAEHRQAQSEFGTNPYNGTISTTTGIRFTSLSFGDDKVACEYVLDHTEKWDVVMAVTVNDPNKPPYWYVGGWAAS